VEDLKGDPRYFHRSARRCFFKGILASYCIIFLTRFQYIASSICSCSKKEENILQCTPPPIGAYADGAYGSGGLLATRGAEQAVVEINVVASVTPGRSPSNQEFLSTKSHAERKFDEWS
jgi:hypothetical protein